MAHSSPVTSLVYSDTCGGKDTSLLRCAQQSSFSTKVHSYHNERLRVARAQRSPVEFVPLRHVPRHNTSTPPLGSRSTSLSIIAYGFPVERLRVTRARRHATLPPSRIARHGRRIHIPKRENRKVNNLMAEKRNSRPTTGHMTNGR